MYSVNRSLLPCALVAVAALAAACANPSAVDSVSNPPASTALQTEEGWTWRKAEVEEKLQAGAIDQARANKTLAADGGFCADQASKTPVERASCGGSFVFECVDLPQVALSGCRNSVRGQSCSAQETDAIMRVQEAVFINCMAEIGWQRYQPGANGAAAPNP